VYVTLEQQIGPLATSHYAHCVLDFPIILSASLNDCHSNGSISLMQQSKIALIY